MPDYHSFRSKTYTVLDIPIAGATMPEAIEQVNHWVQSSDYPRLVCFTNVHMIVEATTRLAFRSVMSGMDLNFPDGAPIFWLGRRKFNDKQLSKISGPEFMPKFCEQSVALGHRHFLFGGAPGVAEATGEALASRFPGIEIAGHYTPSFGPQTPEETAEIVDRINSSDADLLWVCLGCPKQEKWMRDHQHLLKVKVMLAVGQAFDILAGRKRRAPGWISACGMEWAYRLVCEPKRLWKRYGVTNSVFLFLLAREFFSRQSTQAIPAAAQHRSTHLG